MPFSEAIKPLFMEIKKYFENVFENFQKKMFKNPKKNNSKLG